MNVETVTEAFIAWLESENIAEFGVNLFLGQVPLGAPDICYWTQTSGGSVIRKLPSGEKVKQYFVTVNYRSTLEKDIEKNIFKLEELLNCASCVSLAPFDLYDISATSFGSDEDVDSEERRVGTLQANIQIYKKEC